MEEYHLKNISAAQARRILETADRENIDIEEIIEFINKRKEVKKMTDKNNEEKRFTQEEAKVNIYMKENPKVSYREAVLACLDSSEGLKETTQEFAQLSPEEILKMKQMVNDTFYNLSKMKVSKAFGTDDQDKLNQAYNLVVEIQKNLQILIDKNA